jgi:RNA polymerase sigma factor (sigma-70 family)
MSSTSASIESLLALEGWARALARDLVRDTHGAEDLVQRTYLAAIRRPPAAGVPLERWLAGVMRKLLRYEVRSRTARFARERAHARAETNELAADHALRVREAAEGLRAAVEELEEPYRSRITERYFEELEPREIARRWNMTVGTVTSQLTRARNQLRDRLDRRSGGDRESWVLGLVPLLRPQRSPLALGVAAKAALCLPLVALPLVLLWTWIATSPATQPALAAQLGPVARLAALAPGQTGSAE